MQADECAELAEKVALAFALNHGEGTKLEGNENRIIKAGLKDEQIYKTTFEVKFIHLPCWPQA